MDWIATKDQPLPRGERVLAMVNERPEFVLVSSYGLQLCFTDRGRCVPMPDFWTRISPPTQESENG